MIPESSNRFGDAACEFGTARRRVRRRLSAGWPLMTLMVAAVLTLCVSPASRLFAGAMPEPGASSHLSWTTALGPGGAVLPPAPAAQSEATVRLSRLVALLFRPDGKILFIGNPVAQETDPGLTADQLMDAFVVAYRGASTGRQLGVTINPTPEQASRGLRDGDVMNVIYIGGDERTDYGWTAFECDRVMKCLSLGKDNLTGQPFSSKVAGYASEFELSVRLPTREKESWHRFWIAAPAGEVTYARTADGLLFSAEPQLEVNTRYVEPRNGELVDVARDADPAAKQFAKHLTENYAAYAREFPVFGRLALYAQVTRIVAAAYPKDAAAPGAVVADDAHPRPGLDSGWLLHTYQPAAVRTPTTTPALTATTQQVTRQETATQTNVLTSTTLLTGGVDLWPENRYKPADGQTEALLRAALDAHAHEPGRSRWSLTGPRGEQLAMVAPDPKQPPVLWQTDLQVGPLRVVRDRSAAGSGERIGADWTIRIPRLTEDRTLVELETHARVPRAMYLEDGPGNVVALDQPMTATLPGQPETLSYASRDRRRRVMLYGNAKLYLEGDIHWVSINGGPPTMRLGPDDRAIWFSTGAGNPIQRLRTPEGETDFEYEQGRLTLIKDDGGRWIRLVRDAAQMVTGLRSSDGKGIQYVTDPDGRLDFAVDRDGKAIAYRFERDGQTLIGFVADGLAPAAAGQAGAPGGELSNDDGTFRAWPRPSETGAYGASAGDSAVNVAVIILHAALGAQGVEYTMTIRTQNGPGDTIGLDEGVVRLAEKVARGNSTAADRDAITRAFAGSDTFTRSKRLVVLGLSERMSRTLALGLREACADKEVYTAANSELALKNLSTSFQTRGRPKVYVFEAGFPDPKELAQLKQAAAEAPADAPNSTAVIVIGHNTPGFEAFVRALSGEGAFQGKQVLFLTCRNSNTAGMVQDALKRGQASQVLSFTHQLLPGTIADLTGRIGQHMQAGERRLDDVLRAAARELLDDARQAPSPDSDLQEQLRQLEKFENEVGKAIGKSEEAAVAIRQQRTCNASSI